MRIPGVQLVDAGLRAEPDPDAVRLGPADVPEMLALVGADRARPVRGAHHRARPATWASGGPAG